VRLPKLVAEDLGLVPGREVELRQDGARLTLETVPEAKISSPRLQDLLAQIKPGQKPPPLKDWSRVEAPWPDDDWSDVAPRGREWEAMKRKVKAKNGAKRKRRS
jgi:antitoxin component of MazEF toxin-antitoxin module